MVKIIDMQDMRYINLFSKISKVNTRFCFNYNETIIFCVPRRLLSKAIGLGGRNIKKFHEILKKRIKVLSIPYGIQSAEEFTRNVVSPTTFKKMEIKDKEIIINAGKINKASLIGRGKKRFLELQKILKDFFDKELKII